MPEIILIKLILDKTVHIVFGVTTLIQPPRSSKLKTKIMLRLLALDSSSEGPTGQVTSQRNNMIWPCLKPQMSQGEEAR